MGEGMWSLNYKGQCILFPERTNQQDQQWKRSRVGGKEEKGENIWKNYRLKGEPKGGNMSIGGEAPIEKKGGEER